MEVMAPSAKILWKTRDPVFDRLGRNDFSRPVAGFPPFLSVSGPGAPNFFNLLTIWRAPKYKQQHTGSLASRVSINALARRLRRTCEQVWVGLTLRLATRAVNTAVGEVYQELPDWELISSEDSITSPKLKTCALTCLSNPRSETTTMSFSHGSAGYDPGLLLLTHCRIATQIFSRVGTFILSRSLPESKRQMESESE